MDHKIFSEKLERLLNSDYDFNSYKNNWNEIKDSFFKLNLTPSHLLILFKILKIKYLNKNIKILDHGCGGCRTIFYLILFGYNNVYGVDVVSTNKKKYYENINRLIKIALNLSFDDNDRVLIYDGLNLPYKDDYFDFIYSQQVIEHLNDKEFISFIKEEKRTLKNKSFLYHQIPHKLVPTDTHTQTWFVHMLPRKFFILFFKFFKNNNKVKFIENNLFLRFPWKIKREFLNSFNSIEIISHWKSDIYVNNGEFYGVSKILRKLIVCIDKIPMLGKFLSKKISYFLQLEILIRK